METSVEKKMVEIVEKISSLKKGVIYFLALIKLRDREDPKWDFVICADWIRENGKIEDIEFLLGVIRREMGTNITIFSQIVTLKPETDFAQSFAALLLESSATRGQRIYEINLEGRIKLSCVELIEVNLNNFPRNIVKKGKVNLKSKRNSDSKF